MSRNLQSSAPAGKSDRRASSREPGGTKLRGWGATTDGRTLEGGPYGRQLVNVLRTRKKPAQLTVAGQLLLGEEV